MTATARMTNTTIVNRVRDMTTAELVVLTAEIRETGALHLLERPLRALEHEQDRRCVANLDVAHALADRMASEISESLHNPATVEWMRAIFPTD